MSSVYRIALEVPQGAADIFAEALEPLVASVAWRTTEGRVKAEVLGFDEHPPNSAAIMGAMRRCATTAGVQEPNISVTLETARDWTAEHSKQLPPINIGRCFVYGSGYSGAVPAGKIGLRVPAGAAFGSGNHATTKGCLLAMDRMRVISDGPVLDMGSGSGILALAAARLWRRPVLAVDIDPVAVQVATENIAANCQKHLVKGICAPGYRHRDIGSKKFDVIISNILARPLVRMACDLAHHLAPGGIAVLSGLYSQDANWVLGAHRRVGLRKVGRINLDGWATLVMRGKGV